MMDDRYNNESIEKVMEENQILLKKLDKIKGMIVGLINTLTKDMKSKDVYHHSANYFPSVRSIMEAQRLSLCFITHEFPLTPEDIQSLEKWWDGSHPLNEKEDEK